MRLSTDIREKLRNGEFDARLKDIYIDEQVLDHQRDRYLHAIDKFEELYGRKEISIYSAPGRSEVGGNHTDHQRGQVLACAVNLDAIAVVAKRDDGYVHIVSDSMNIKPINTNELDKNAEENGTSIALVKGVLYKLQSDGYKIGGFDAYITSEVLVGAGLSSSAAFEVLIGTIESYVYNEGKVSPVYIAQISQYAENEYFGKPCGLMDQMASSVGNLINIDFEDSNNPKIKKVDCDFEVFGYSLCIVDSKGDHADLTPDYAAIPAEMKSIAGFYGKEVLIEVNPEKFYEDIPVLRKRFGDRAVLRAIHFYCENERVGKEVKALEKGRFDKFLKNVKASGDSSFEFLQNVYSPSQPENQGVALGIAFSKQLLKGIGVCRVHGGGFAGTIQAFVLNEKVNEYKTEIEKYFGEGSCHVLKVRKYGGMEVL